MTSYGDQPAAEVPAGEVLGTGSRRDRARDQQRTAGTAPAPGGRRRTLVRRAVAAAVVAAALVGAYLVAVAVFYDPERTVEAYFDALQSDDLDAALEQVNPAALEGVGRDMLTTEVLEVTDVEARVTGTRRDGDTAEVTVEVEGSGPTTFQLSRDGSQNGVFPRWRIDTPVSRVHVVVEGGDRSEAPESVEVSGVESPVTPEGVAVFPGQYDVSARLAYPYASSHAVVVAPGNGDVTATLSAVLDPEVLEAAQREVNAYLDRCTDYDRPFPPGCPWEREEWEGLTNFTWTLETYPAVRMVPAPGGGSLLVTTDREGEVHFSAVREADGSGVEQTYAYDVNGTMTLNAGGSLFFLVRRA